MGQRVGLFGTTLGNERPLSTPGDGSNFNPNRLEHPDDPFNPGPLTNDNVTFVPSACRSPLSLTLVSSS